MATLEGTEKGLLPKCSACLCSLEANNHTNVDNVTMKSHAKSNVFLTLLPLILSNLDIITFQCFISETYRPPGETLLGLSH